MSCRAHAFCGWQIIFYTSVGHVLAGTYHITYYTASKSKTLPLHDIPRYSRAQTYVHTRAHTLTGSANNAPRPPHASPRVHLVICSSCSMQISCCCLWWSCCCALRLRPVKALTRDPNETISLLCCSRAHRDRNAERAGEREKEHARARRGVKRATHVYAH